MATQAQQSEAASDRKLKIITAIGIVIAIFLFFVFIFGGPKPKELVEEDQIIQGQENINLGLPSE